MGRRCYPRRVSWFPVCCCFRPEVLPPRGEVVMSIDELEALRLADVEGLYQEEGALSMGVSRSTFARMLRAARRKVAEALIMGKILHVEGGEVISVENSSVNRERGC